MQQPLVANSTDQNPSALNPAETGSRVVLRIGQATYLRKDLEKLTVGSRLVLESLAADPVDILVDGQLAARGEVLVRDGSYCVRICEIIADQTVLKGSR